MVDVDVVVVGGGIIGLATAWQLTKRNPQTRIVLVEKERAIAQHQTGHNSGVIHSGVYYKPGSLKARTCAEGRAALLEFCKANDVPYKLIGKVIVATANPQIPALDELARRAKANGVVARSIDTAELVELEPNAVGVAALHVPGAGIVDYKEVCDRLARLLTESGVEIRTDTLVTAIDEHADRVTVSLHPGSGAPSTDDSITADRVITCGGLHSDTLARYTNPKLDEQILPFRGEYYELVPTRRSLVNGLIYPVPDPRFPFLGVHLTRMIDGSVHAGPNAVLALAREGYEKTDLKLSDLARVLRFRGWWRLAARYWQTGVGEYYRSFSKKAFVEALQGLVPALVEEDLIPSESGVRAQAVTGDGHLVDDFVWVESDRVLNVLNAPSPAATASFAIGAQIATRATKP